MKTFLAFTIVLSVVLLAACGKDKFETKPDLEFVDYNKIVDSAGILKFRINYFDKEGDLSQAPFTAVRVRLNKFPPPSPILADVYNSNLPEFPEKNKAEITFQLGYSSLDESINQNDSMLFKFVVTDKAGNMSDTLTSDLIVARKP